ncbi:MAG: hypothetical protein OK422_01810 [Thaumarchaeota archaeon]|nr:hypothetical protein [Nitrososphaerota archaeon]
MPIYWMIGYNIREGRVAQYQKFLGSREFKKMCEKIFEQTGVKFVQCYFSIIPSSSEQGDFDAYDMWEVPNHAALDKVRKTNAFGEMIEKTYLMTEPRPLKWVTLRTARDVKIMYEPKPKK